MGLGVGSWQSLPCSKRRPGGAPFPSGAPRTGGRLAWAPRRGWKSRTAKVIVAAYARANAAVARSVEVLNGEGSSSHGRKRGRPPQGRPFPPGKCVMCGRSAEDVMCGTLRGGRLTWATNGVARVTPVTNQARCVTCGTLPQGPMTEGTRKAARMMSVTERLLMRDVRSKKSLTSDARHASPRTCDVPKG